MSVMIAWRENKTMKQKSKQREQEQAKGSTLGRQWQKNVRERMARPRQSQLLHDAFVSSWKNKERGMKKRKMSPLPTHDQARWIQRLNLFFLCPWLNSFCWHSFLHASLYSISKICRCCMPIKWMKLHTL